MSHRTTGLVASALLALGAVAPTAGAQAGGAPAQQAAFTPASAASREADAQAIRARSMQWLAASRSRNLDGLMANFSDDAVAVYDGKLLAGAAAIRRFEAAGFAENAKKPGYVLSWQTTSVDVAQAADLAIESGTWSERWNGAGNQRQGNYLTVWRKVGGVWKVARDISVPEGTPEPAKKGT
jgi:uncharacterized protein (TIGR02246 family)